MGETGVGKSMFAELMHRFAIESKILRDEAPFIQFNCADYADNPQLVMAQIFGVKKGAYTGANQDNDGFLKKADGGIIFLDEVHRLFMAMGIDNILETLYSEDFVYYYYMDKY